MSQATDYVIANDTHANVRADINAVLAASVSMNSGSSGPSGTTYGHMLWADTTTTPSIVSIRDASNATWYQLFTDTGLFRSENGAAASVAYGPASDIDTGWHFATAVTIAGVTAGVERVHMSATETVFNETGVDTDFRVEASGVANALFVQGSDGYVGINNSAPANILDIQSDGAAVVQLQRSSTDATGASYHFRKSRGTAASPSAVSSGDFIGIIRSYAYHTTGTPGWTNAAAITMAADGAPSGDYVPARMTFETGSTSAAATERMRIDSSGYIGIGKTNGGSALVEIATTANSGFVQLNEYHAADAFGAAFGLYKSRGTVSSPSNISAGDIVGLIQANGYYNSGWRGAGGLSFVSTAVSGSIVQAYASIYTYNTAGSAVQRYVTGEYVTLTNSSATTLFTMTCASNTSAGCILNYFVEVLDASNDVQSISGSCYIAIVNKGGSVTTNVSVIGTVGKAVSTGTLLAAVTASSASPSVIAMTPISSLTPTLLRCIYSVENLSNQALTI